MSEITSFGEWSKICVLGEGSFGEVTLWCNRKSEDSVAIKRCRLELPGNVTNKQRQRWTQEVDFMRNVQHPNIVGYKQLPQAFIQQLNHNNPSGLPLLPMEYCSGGNLRRRLLNPKNACGLREIEVRRVLDDISSAVSYLHQLQITHRDIKPENVVLKAAGDGRIVYKLIDLGYAKDMNVLMSYVGTLAYTAPEIFRNESYNHNVDYWSFGVMAYEVCCGRHPFIPKVIPVKRFALIEKKGPRDICVYQASTNKIIYTDKIVEPNHLSSWLRTHLEDWLSAMLQYRSADRGITQTGTNVFTILKSILDKQTLHVFSVYNYNHYYYEINTATKVQHLHHFIQESTGIPTIYQVILVSGTNLEKPVFYSRLQDLNALLITDLGLSAQSTLVVCMKNEFVFLTTHQLPPAVKNLLQPRKVVSEQLSLWTSLAVHYIEEETVKMAWIRWMIDEMFVYLKGLLCGQENTELVPMMRTAGHKALIMVNFCKGMNADCWYDQSKVDAIRNQRKIMWKVRELIDNVNSAIVRFYKARARTRLLTASKEKVLHLLDGMEISSIYETALKTTNSHNLEPSITSEDIARSIHKCVKTRTDIQRNSIIIQYMLLCYKVLREHHKLTRWIKALTKQLGTVSTDLLEAQKGISRSEKQMVASTSSACSSLTLNGRDDLVDIQDESLLDNGRVYQDLPTVDVLVKDNRMLRCKFQDVLAGLLSAHKDHAMCVGEFVQYVDSTVDTNENNQG